MWTATVTAEIIACFQSVSC